MSQPLLHPTELKEIPEVIETENAILIPKVSSGEGMIHEEKLDEQSGYSHVYITSVYHDDVKELKKKLKSQFYKISNSELTEEEYMKKIDPNFENEISEINLEEKEDPENEINGKEIKNQKKDLFYYALSVALLSATIQISFIITIIKEYFNEPHFITDDPELITIRLLAFLTITLKLWIELGNGRKIVNHGFYQSFLYRSNNKRILSIFMGFVQIFTTLSTYFCSSELIVQTESVIDCVKDFSALIVLTEIDNWIGDYFLNTSKQMQVYSRDYVCQIYVLRKKDYYRYNLSDFCIDFCVVGTFIFSIVPIYQSIVFYGDLNRKK